MANKIQLKVNFPQYDTYSDSLKNLINFLMLTGKLYYFTDYGCSLYNKSLPKSNITYNDSDDSYTFNITDVKPDDADVYAYKCFLVTHPIVGEKVVINLGDSTSLDNEITFLKQDLETDRDGFSSSTKVSIIFIYDAHNDYNRYSYSLLSNRNLPLYEDNYPEHFNHYILSTLNGQSSYFRTDLTYKDLFEKELDATKYSFLKLSKTISVSEYINKLKVQIDNNEYIVYCTSYINETTLTDDSKELPLMLPEGEGLYLFEDAACTEPFPYSFSNTEESIVIKEINDIVTDITAELHYRINMDDQHFLYLCKEPVSATNNSIYEITMEAAGKIFNSELFNITSDESLYKRVYIYYKSLKQGKTEISSFYRYISESDINFINQNNTLKLKLDLTDVFNADEEASILGVVFYGSEPLKRFSLDTNYNNRTFISNITDKIKTSLNTYYSFVFDDVNGNYYHYFNKDDSKFNLPMEVKVDPTLKGVTLPNVKPIYNLSDDEISHILKKDNFINVTSIPFTSESIKGVDWALRTSSFILAEPSGYYFRSDDYAEVKKGYNVYYKIAVCSSDGDDTSTQELIEHLKLCSLQYTINNNSSISVLQHQTEDRYNLYHPDEGSKYSYIKDLELGENHGKIIINGIIPLYYIGTTQLSGYLLIQLYNDDGSVFNEPLERTPLLDVINSDTEPDLSDYNETRNIKSQRILLFIGDTDIDKGYIQSYVNESVAPVS